jgi:hypothetical protein
MHALLSARENGLRIYSLLAFKTVELSLTVVMRMKDRLLAKSAEAIIGMFGGHKRDLLLGA